MAAKKKSSKPKAKPKTTAKPSPEAEAQPAPAPAPAPPPPEPAIAEAAAVSEGEPAPPTEQDSRPKASLVFRGMGRWLKKHVPEAIVFAVLGAAVAWIVNVVLMAVRYEGYNVPPGAPVTGISNAVSGSLFWLVASSVFFGIVSYRREVGGKRFWAEIRGFPPAVGRVFSTDGGRAVVHLLWGFAGCMLAAQIISPSLGLALAVALLVTMPSILGDVIADLLQRIWSGILNAVAPSRRAEITAPVAMIVGQIGVALAFVVAFFFAGRIMKILLMLAAAVGAFILSQAVKRPPAATAALILFAVVGSLAIIFSSSPVYADDGGWLECGGTLTTYLRCGAAGGVYTVVFYAFEGAIASFFGAIIGAAIGGALGELPRGRLFRLFMGDGQAGATTIPEVSTEPPKQPPPAG